MNWNELSMADRTNYIRLGLDNGITNLKLIKDTYNEYANGGYKDSEYYNFMEKLADHKANEWGISSDEALITMLNDNTYNYKQMYMDSLIPDRIISNGHFPDTYKTVYHPTFSDESMYDPRHPRFTSSDYNPINVPYNINRGGHWSKDSEVFELSDTQDRKYSQQYLDDADPGYIALSPQDTNITLSKSQRRLADTIYNTAIKNGASHAQAVAMVSNAFIESDSFNGTNQYKGSAVGYYQMEEPERKKYKDWLKRNKKKDTISSETEYVLSSMNSGNQKTAWDRAMESSGNDESIVLGEDIYKTAKHPFHIRRTSKDSYNDWESDNVDRTTYSFLRLYERAGKPHANRRVGAARYFDKLYINN